MLYLYGAVRPGQDAPDQPGIGDPPPPVWSISGADASLLVSDLPDDYALQDEDARSHLQVLTAALRDGPVVPLRMGTVAESEREAREVLTAGGQQLRAALDALDGLVELEVDADDDEAAAIAAVGRQIPSTPSAPADLATRIDLGQQVATLVMEHRRAVAAHVVERLRRLAVDDVPRSQISGPEDPILRWAFLVKRADIESFDEAMTA